MKEAMDKSFGKNFAKTGNIFINLQKNKIFYSFFFFSSLYYFI
jgi:hypothetical protein